MQERFLDSWHNLSVTLFRGGIPDGYHLKEALDIVKAQASVRIMSEDEIISMVRRLSSDIKNVAEGVGCVEELASSDVRAIPANPSKKSRLPAWNAARHSKF